MVGLAIQVSRIGRGPRVVEAAVSTALVSKGGCGEESAKETIVTAKVR